MLELLGTLALFAAQSEEIVVEKEKDPIVCRGDRSSRALGSNIRRGQTCKPKSEWKLEEEHSRRELRQISDRWKDPGRADGR